MQSRFPRKAKSKVQIQPLNEQNSDDDETSSHLHSKTTKEAKKPRKTILIDPLKLNSKKKPQSEELITDTEAQPVKKRKLDLNWSTHEYHGKDESNVWLHKEIK